MELTWHNINDLTMARQVLHRKKKTWDADVS